MFTFGKAKYSAPMTIHVMYHTCGELIKTLSYLPPLGLNCSRGEVTSGDGRKGVWE